MLKKIDNMMPITGRADDEFDPADENRYIRNELSQHDMQIRMLEEERRDLQLELAITNKAMEAMTEAHINMEEQMRRAFHRGFWSGVLNPHDHPKQHWDQVKQYLLKK
jgi:hypothetical protein